MASKKRYFTSSSSSSSSSSDSESEDKQPIQSKSNETATQRCKKFLTDLKVVQKKPVESSDDNDDDDEDEESPKEGASFKLIRNHDHERQLKIDKIPFLSPQRPFKLPNIPDKATLDKRAKEIQIAISKQGRYVNWNEIMYELLCLYPNCSHIGHLGLTKVDDLPSIGDLIRIQRKVDTFLLIYEYRLPCITLLDLEDTLCAELTYFLTKYPAASNATTTANHHNGVKIDCFDQLNLGPLIQNLLVRRIFNIPEHVQSLIQMKPIRFQEILKLLLDYLNDTQSWSSIRINQLDLENYLAEKENVNSIRMLGMKIINVGLLIGTIKSVQHLFSATLRENRQTLAAEYQQMQSAERENILRCLKQKFELYRSQSESSDHKRIEIEYESNVSYLSKDAVDVISELLEIFKSLLNKNEFDYVNDFLQLLKDSVYLRDVFQLAICMGVKNLFTSLDNLNRNVQHEHYHQPIEYDGDSGAENHVMDHHGDDDETAYKKSEFFHKYRHFLERLFFVLVEKFLHSTKKIKRFLNRFLKEKSLRIVESTYKRFNDKEKSSDDSESDSEPMKPVNKRKGDQTLLHNPNVKRTRQNDEDQDVDQLKKNITDLLDLKHRRINKIEDLLQIENQIFDHKYSLINYLSDERENLSFSFELKHDSEPESSTNCDDSAFDERKERLLIVIYNFVNQLKRNMSKEELEKSCTNYLCHYFKIDELKQLGIGDLDQ